MRKKKQIKKKQNKKQILLNYRKEDRMAKSFVKSIPIEEVNANTFGVRFVPINPDGLDEACFLIRIINASNVNVTISYNGVEGNDFIPPNEVLQLNFQTNSSPNGFIALLRKGTIVFANAPLAGVGSVVLSGYYQEI